MNGRAAAILALVGSTLVGGCLTDPEDAIRFADPALVVARAGDTLEAIALRHAVQVADLRAWNGLTLGESLSPGDQLLVWFPPAPSLAEVMPGDGSRYGLILNAQERRARRPRGGGGGARRRDVQPLMVPGETIVVGDHGSVHNAGVLGALADGQVQLDDKMNSEFTNQVANLKTRAMEDRGGDLVQRANSLAGGGTAESLGGPVAQLRAIGQQKPSTSGVGTGAIRAPRLAMPTPKRCLSGPDASQLTAEEGMLASEGLDAGQIRRALSGFVRYTTSCIPKGTRGTFSVVAEITAGCDGRVSEVWIANDGGLPSNVTSCIKQTLGYAGFPAHALPDGMTFQYPIQYRY